MSEFPSKENQFKAGKSGNPSGRPKGSRNRSTIVRELLEADAPDGLGQVADQITRAIISKAIKGDVKAYKELMDGAYGKIKDTAENKVIYQKMGSVKLLHDDGIVENLDFNIGTSPS